MGKILIYFMEYSYDINKIFKSSENIVKIDSRNCNFRNKNLNDIIDNLGLKSMLAQKLPSIITTSIKFWNTDHILYV